MNHLKNTLLSAASTAKALQMKISIETNVQGSGCKVWLGETAVSFPSLEDAKAYIAQLEERIEYASHAFAQDAGKPEAD
ncbi:hypothetical protein ACTACD_13055 [Pseudomonas syringae]|uniref:hypothetical protein n=1 Tax=Pseudomonas syringae TaxID=317 RepID=UPI003F767F89